MRIYRGMVWDDDLAAEEIERVASALPHGVGADPILECETYVVDGRVEVRWPQGRGRVVVSPEVIEAWAEHVNALPDQIHPAT